MKVLSTIIKLIGPQGWFPFARMIICLSIHHRISVLILPVFSASVMDKYIYLSILENKY